MSRFVAVPVTQRQAFAFIKAHHRHHPPPQSDVFRVALALDGVIIGVASVDHPVARALNDGITAEVRRVCVIERADTKHAASKLYAMCWRIAREMGYCRLITYTLHDESGVSLTAAGWRAVYQTNKGSWDTPSRERHDKHPIGAKTLWEVA